MQRARAGRLGLSGVRAFVVVPVATEDAQRVAARIAEERARLSGGLAARGLAVCPGEANVLLFRSGDAALHEKLAARGVLIRNCANYRGLGAGYYRTAVRSGDDTARLFAALDAIRKEGC